MRRSRRIARTLAHLVLVFAAVIQGEVRLQTDPAARAIHVPPERIQRVESIVGFRGVATVPIVGLTESQADRLGVPPWVSGFAGRGVIAVIPARAVAYPNDGLEDLVLHELAHILIEADVPRWFNEGVAMFAATGWSLDDQTRLAVTMISAGEMPLSRLDGLFSGDVASVSRAYSLAGAFVRFLVERHGIES